MDDKLIQYVYDEVITGVRIDDLGYISIQLGKGKHYVPLNHGYFADKYLVFYEDKKNYYIFLNKKDIAKVLDFVKNIKIKEDN